MFFCFVLFFCFPARAQESRKHYNQLEEARKQQHARKLKLEAQEVALGERDRVTATLGDSLFVGEKKTTRGLVAQGSPTCILPADPSTFQPGETRDPLSFTSVDFFRAVDGIKLSQV